MVHVPLLLRPGCLASAHRNILPPTLICPVLPLSTFSAAVSFETVALKWIGIKYVPAPTEPPTQAPASGDSSSGSSSSSTDGANWGGDSQDVPSDSSSSGSSSAKSAAFTPSSSGSGGGGSNTTMTVVFSVIGGVFGIIIITALGEWGDNSAVADGGMVAAEPEKGEA